MTNAPLPSRSGAFVIAGASTRIARKQSHVARARPILPRPVLRERAGGRGISTTRCSDGFYHQVLAAPAQRVRQVTLTLTLSRRTGRGNAGKHTVVLRFAPTDSPASRTPPP